MDQVTPVHHEKTVRFLDFAHRNPAIDRFSVTPNDLRKFWYRQVLARCGPVLALLPAHGRLSSRHSDALVSMSSVTWRRAMSQSVCQSENPTNLGFESFCVPRKVCNVQIWHAHFMNRTFPRIAALNPRLTFGSLGAEAISISDLARRGLRMPTSISDAQKRQPDRAESAAVRLIFQP
jgi:hypothetical protein